MRKFLLVLLIVVFVPTLVRAQADPALIELAKKEGEVVFYSSSATVDVQFMIESFRKKYPFIKATYYRSGDDALINRVRTEAKTGRFSWDVLDTTTFPAYWLTKQGFYTRYLPPERASVRKGHLDEKGLWTSAHSNIHVLIYNTRLVAKADVPKTHEGLLDPKLKGKMAMDTKAYEWMANLLNVMGEERGMVFMRKLGEQNISFRTGRTLQRICKTVP